MELRRTISTLALGGAVLVAVAGTASARDFDHRAIGIVAEDRLWNSMFPMKPHMPAVADSIG